jgi:hypothetical protein
MDGTSLLRRSRALGMAILIHALACRTAASQTAPGFNLDQHYLFMHRHDK